jgi:prepilin-type N-terminal cleavage/methylation domain-containing protein
MRYRAISSLLTIFGTATWSHTVAFRLFLRNNLDCSGFETTMRKTGNKSGFTLVELLVVVTIIAILTAISLQAYGVAIRHANSAGCMTRMHGLGIAFTLYSSDNDGQLPGRVTGAGNDKWPTLLQPYLSSVKDFVDPGDPIAMQVAPDDLVSNSANNSSFFFNGFNDLGAYDNPSIQVRLVNLGNLSNVILLGQKINGNTQYYMDFVEGNQDDILNKTAYFNGADYVFGDGSARFIYKTDYDDKMWITNPNYVIPPIPTGH